MGTMGIHPSMMAMMNPSMPMGMMYPWMLNMMHPRMMFPALPFGGMVIGKFCEASLFFAFELTSHSTIFILFFSSSSPVHPVLFDDAKTPNDFVRKPLVRYRSSARAADLTSAARVATTSLFLGQFLGLLLG